MRRILKALCAAALVTPLLAVAADAAPGGIFGARPGGGGDGGGSGGGGSPPASVGPQGGGGGGGFNRGGGGFSRGDGGFNRGGGGFRGDRFRGRDRFSGSIFIGSGFGPGWYDPFWWPYGPYGYGGYGYGYGYGYYPPPRVVERVYAAPPEDYLVPPDGPPPAQNWYHCPNPEGYYPYVRECNAEWEAVPVTPDGPPGPPRQGG